MPKLEEVMSSNRTNRLAWFAAGLLAAGLFIPVVSSGQGTAPIVNSNTGININDQARVVQEEQLKENGGDPREYAAYAAFHNVSLQQIDKKIQLGETFVNKYPNSLWIELVYQELAQTYYSKRD